MARTGRHGNVAFKKEAAFGTYLAGDIYLRAASESIENQITNVEDEALVGEIYTTEMVKVGENVTGSIEGALHGDTAGIMLYGVTSSETAVSNPPNAYIIVNYTGSELYARLTLTGTTLLAETGSASSLYVGDANFGASTGIDLSTAPYDTATELSAAIDGFTGWAATLFGDGSEGSSVVAAFAATEVHNNDVKVGAKILPYPITSTVAKLHTLNPAASATDLPSWSFTVNRVLGTNQSLGFVGVKFPSLNITITASDLLKFSLGIDGKAEETAKTDLSLTLPTVQAFTATNTKILIVDDTGAQTDFDEVKDLSFTINTNVDDNRVVGSVSKLEQTRQKATIEVSFTANNTSGQYGLRTKYTAGTSVSMYIYTESNTNADTTNSVPYSILLRLPRMKFTNYNSPLNTPDRLVITAAATAEKPQNTVYTKHLYAYVVDTDITTY